MKQLRIAINSQILPGGASGGIEQFIIALVHALGRLDGGHEKYTLVTHPASSAWVEEHIGQNTVVVRRPWRGSRERLALASAPLRQLVKTAVGPLGRAMSEKMRTRRKPEMPKSNGFWESLDVDLIHFPYQDFTVSEIPSIYNPHDLQHLWFPEFFTPWAIRTREMMYRAGCSRSQAVVVASHWVKDDIARRYEIENSRILVFPLAPPTEIYCPVTDEHISYIRRVLSLPDAFAFYPAQSWPHKNHIRLLEAIAMLREEENLRINLVCTGARNAFWPEIAKRVAELRLGSQVRFLGFLNPRDLRAVYRLSQFVVIPTLFEAASLPMFEAWQEGAPVACSTATSLPEQAGDAAMLFDPTAVEEIATALRCMASDSELRESLRERARCRLDSFSWERTARMYRALYRKIGGSSLTEEDKALLNGGAASQTPATKGLT